MYNVASGRALALSLLSVAVLAVYLPGWFSSEPLPQARAAYVADVDFWQRTDHEQQVTATFPLDLNHDLAQIPLELGPWQGQDVPETNREVFILLEPEQFVQRRYTNPQNQFVWLTLIGGRALRSFHPPDLCYIADGWTTALSSRTITLAGGGELPGLWLSAQKLTDATEQRSFYFYLFPNAGRAPADGLVLVRITSPPYGSDEETLAVQSDFLGRLFTGSKAKLSRQTSGCPHLPAAGTTDEAAIRALLQAEGQAVVERDSTRLMALWRADGRVVDANHTPNNPQDDQVWAGTDAIRSRYLHHVFPGAPQSIQPADVTLTISGATATAISTTHIDDEIAPGGDRWQFRNVNGCWQIQELVFNLEPSPATQP